MSENLVRDIHDAVAHSDNPAEASVRPPATTARELRAMRRDVLRKLRLRADASVIEIGCGVGLLGVPIAERTARYVGLDFAPRTVEVANERLRAAGLADRATVLCGDVLSDGEQSPLTLGRFDRVLVYSAFHYARSEHEAVRFLQRSVDLLAPGGRALIGNVPLEDLRVDWTASGPMPQGVLARASATARWMLSPGVARVPLTRRWKLRRVLETILRHSSPPERFAPARLPPDYVVPLSTMAVERWLATLAGDFVHHWELPAPGVPLAPARADLVLVHR